MYHIIFLYTGQSRLTSNHCYNKFDQLRKSQIKLHQYMYSKSLIPVLPTQLVTKVNQCSHFTHKQKTEEKEEEDEGKRLGVV